MSDAGRVVEEGTGRKGLSHMKFAALIGRSESWVSEIETNSIRLKDLYLAERIADVLGVTLANVLGLEPRYLVGRHRRWQVGVMSSLP